MSNGITIEVYNKTASGAPPIQIIETEIANSSIFVQPQENVAPINVQVYESTTSGTFPIQVIQSEFTGVPIYIQVQEDYAPVQSVNGKIGWVVIDKNDIGLSNVENISISGVSGYLQHQIDNLDTGYASQFEFNILSGYLINTGANLQSQINNLYSSGFITGVDLSNLYPRSNPSGFITGIDTTNFYTKDNPSGFITGVDTSNFYTKDNPSGFITGVDTSNFYTKDNPSGFITGVDTSSLYPRSNPSGFITGVDTSNFYTKDNPSGFITGVDLSSYATISNLALTGSTLQTNINSLSGNAVLVYGDQTIYGTKYFNNSVYVHDLYVTGTEFIANVENNFIESPFILLNLTGGAVDGGIFFVTGTGLTGINDYGPIIGFDHTDKFKFGFARRSDDLSVLNDIAAVQDITNYSGFANNNFYLKSNPSGFITGVDLSSYATVNNLALTGSNLQTQINNINSSGFITGVDLSNYATNLNLQNTGQNLNQKIDNLSGYSIGNFATINNLNLTGSGLQQNINIVSGNLGVTGQNLQSQIDVLSVNSIAYAIALG